MDSLKLIKVEKSFDLKLGRIVMGSKFNMHFFPLHFGEGEKYIL